MHNRPSKTALSGVCITAAYHTGYGTLVHTLQDSTGLTLDKRGSTVHRHGLTALRRKAGAKQGAPFSPK